MSNPWLASDNPAWLMLDVIYRIRNSRSNHYGTGARPIGEQYGLPSSALKVPIEWVDTNGDPYMNPDWVQWKEFMVSNGSTLPIALISDEDRDNLFKKKQQDTYNKKPKRPWRNYKIERSERLQDIWSNLDDVYDWRLTAETYINVYGADAGNGYRSAAEHFGYNPYGKAALVFQTMIKYIKEVGDPRLDQDWKEFQNEVRSRDSHQCPLDSSIKEEIKSITE